MFQVQLLSRRPDSLPVQQLQQQKRGTRRRAAAAAVAEQQQQQSRRGSSTMAAGARTPDDGCSGGNGDGAGGEMTPCRRARLSLELNLPPHVAVAADCETITSPTMLTSTAATNCEDSENDAFLPTADEFPFLHKHFCSSKNSANSGDSNDNSNCKKRRRPASRRYLPLDEDIRTASINQFPNGGEMAAADAVQQQQNCGNFLRELPAEMSTCEEKKAEQKSMDQRCWMELPPPSEPMLEHSHLLGSSPSGNFSTSSYSSSAITATTFSSSMSSTTTSSASPRVAPLSGSFSCANLSRIPSIPVAMPITNSCSSSALDQLQSTEPTLLFDHLYLGSQKDALDADLLARLGITRVINLSENCPRATTLADDAQHFLRIPVNDTYAAKLLPHFESAYQFIEEAKQAGERVLMHCLAGISRSPTLAIAYVMRSKRMTNDEAYSYVKSRRPTISPNFNFLGQLWEYERQLRQQQILPPAPSSSCEEKREKTPETSVVVPAVASSSSSSSSSTLSPVLNINGKRPMLAVKDKDEEEEKPSTTPAVTTTHQQKMEEQEKQQPQQRPVARPRQLLGSLNSRLSCPPSLISAAADFPSPNCNNKDIPSPSTEFSRLDISLANPCFGLLPGPQAPQQQHQHQQNNIKMRCPPRRKAPPSLSPLFSAASMLENPVFGNSCGPMDSSSSSWRPRRLDKANSKTSIQSADNSSSASSNSSGVSSASTSLCSGESFCSSLNDSFSSLEEFGGGASFGAGAAMSTRNCLADTDGDELVRWGPPRGGPIIEFVDKKPEEHADEDERQQQLEKRAETERPNRYENGWSRTGTDVMMMMAEQSKQQKQQLFRQEEEKKSREQQPLDQHTRKMKQMHEEHVKMFAAGAADQQHQQQRKKLHLDLGFRRCMLTKSNLLPAHQQQVQLRHFHTANMNMFRRCGTYSQQQQFQAQTSRSQEKGKMTSSATATTSSTSSSLLNRPKLAKSCCIDRFLAFGRKRNAAVPGAQFRQSLPTIGDDRGQEEEEEERDEAAEEERKHQHAKGTDVEEESNIGVFTTSPAGQQQQLEPPPPYLDPDCASISSASSLEIAVQ